MSKYTPGPWNVRHDFKCANGDLVLGVAAEKGGAVAWPHGKDDIQELANARLIAAAPELLEALIRIVKFADSEPDGGVTVQMHRSNIEKARAVITKAKGE